MRSSLSLATHGEVGGRKGSPNADLERSMPVPYKAAVSYPAFPLYDPAASLYFLFKVMKYLKKAIN
ncbi:MAG: hypothetical protein IJO05_09115 [Oscillospiraceae bacterium]|nr:hypothetical protein [Oscillospiraceae bacterium]